MTSSECLPARLNPLAERTCFSRSSPALGSDSPYTNVTTMDPMCGFSLPDGSNSVWLRPSEQVLSCRNPRPRYAELS
jgi:hypothetical protein